MYLKANSIYGLKYFLIKTTPNMNQITVNTHNGQVTLNSPLNPFFVSQNVR